MNKSNNNNLYDALQYLNNLILGGPCAAKPVEFQEAMQKTLQLYAVTETELTDKYDRQWHQ